VVVFKHHLINTGYTCKCYAGAMAHAVKQMVSRYILQT
jgi:hypothetical protein